MYYVASENQGETVADNTVRLHCRSNSLAAVRNRAQTLHDNGKIVLVLWGPDNDTARTRAAQLFGRKVPFSMALESGS